MSKTLTKNAPGMEVRQISNECRADNLMFWRSELQRARERMPPVDFFPDGPVRRAVTECLVAAEQLVLSEEARLNK